MADLVIIVPSRGRPEAAKELAANFADTCTADTVLCFAIDADDPRLPGYKGVVQVAQARGQLVGEVTVTGGRNMVDALNHTAAWMVKPENAHPPFAVGFMGDDHRPRTVGWDTAYLEALRGLGTGIVYGNDLYQGENLPTQVAMTADIVRALGFMAPPALWHMFVDNFWRDLGRAAGCLRYLPDVVVEHMHPAAGKAEADEGHLRVNAPEVYQADGKAYAAYRAGPMTADVAKLKTLRGEPPKLGAFSRQPSTRGAYRQSTTPSTGDVHEWRLFPEGTVPEYTRPEWYAGREHAPHLEQAGHRERLHQTATFVAQAAFQARLSTVVDLGAGDGGLLSLLGPALSAWGYDLMPANLDAAKDRSVDVRYGDVVDGDIEWGQIAVCTEMLEHLVDPHSFVRRIAQHTQALVCSSPRDERPGNAYEFHTWAWDLEGYRALVEQGGFTVLRQRNVGPFQVILAVKR